MTNIKLKYLFLVIGIATFSFLSSCSEKIEKPESFKIILVETSDVHGAVFDYDFINDKKSSGSLSKVHTYVNELRKNNEVILMDNGDILQGQPVVYYYNYENTEDKHICSEVMNYMQYDVATIGNHDIEAGHSVYDKLKLDFKFPWLAANAIDIETGEPYFEPYTIINKKGVKIAVLGLITPGIPKWLPEELWTGIKFEDMVVSAKEWVPLIMKNEKPDLLIGLFHSGYDYTYGNADYNTPENENASKIVAEQVPGFDVIFVGHDHRTWNEKIKNLEGDEVLILGPTSSARQVVTASIEMNLNHEGKYIKKINGSVIEMKDVKPDSLFNDHFKNEFNKVKQFVSKQVGAFEETVDGHEALYGPSVFIDLIQQIQLEISGAEISFAAPLSYHSVIEKGPVYVRDMFKLYRFENFLYTIRLTGKEIDDYLEFSYAGWFNQMTGPDDHLLNFKKDDNGELIFSDRYNSFMLQSQFYNFDAAAGINYIVDLKKEDNNKVSIISLSNGNGFYKDSTYKVAINSYRGNGGGGHLSIGAALEKDEITNRRINSTEKDLRYYMMSWMEEQGSVNPEAFNNWKVIPEEWWQKGKVRDEKLLNSKK
ncbi:MAG: bifunctional metallophosphatase/5'-nucleotidase [Marinilabiliales bacterium]|nr:MAG: bifunctional metallophosphatase/5'-nucleotidase [Marinilabiliales bacterium]